MVKRGLLIVLVLFLLCAPLVFSDEISVITYGNATSLVRNQDLEYLSCIDGKHTFDFTQLICADNYATIKATASKISDSCYYTNINLEKYGCNEYTIESYYIVNGNDKKITKEVTTNTVLASPTFILDAQDWDGGWGSASNTAYALWVLSKFGSLYSLQITDGMNWLKDNRQNEPKCWVNAQGECSPSETIKSLAFLKLANVSEGNRIVNDGISYVESLQKYTSSTAWNAKIEATEDSTYCNLTADSSAIISQVFLNDSQQVTEDFTADYGTILNMSCSEQVRLTLYDNRGTEKFTHMFDEDSATDYDDGLIEEDEDETQDEQYKIIRIQNPCWAADTELWSSCDAGLTVYALSLGIDSTRKTAAKTWLVENLENHSVTGKFVSSATPEADSAFYLMNVDAKNTDILDWLIYSQNNDGSFGSSTDSLNIQATAIAYLALEKISFPQKTEVLRDAAHWMSQMYTGRSYDDIVTDSGQFQILSKTARPYLRSLTDGIVALKNDQQKVVQFKPVGAQVINSLQAKTYNADGVLSDLLTVNVPAKLDGNSTLSVTLQGKATPAGNTSGYVLISGIVDSDSNSTNIRRIYFTVERDPVFSISPQKTNYNAYDGQFKYLFDVSAINVPVSCEVQVQSDKLIGPRQVQISKVGVFELPITIDGANDEKIQGTGTLICDKVGTQVIIPFDVDVYAHSEFPFSVEPVSITLNSYEKSFTIKVRNLIDEMMEVGVDTQFPSDLYVVEPFKTQIEGKKSVTIEYSTTFLDIENISDMNVIKITAYDKTIEVPLVIEISNTPTSLGFIIGFTLLITLIATAGYIAYNWKDLGPQFEELYGKMRHKSGKSGSSTGGVTAFKKKDIGRETMMDIIAIMQSMEKSEPEIIARLESEGYSRPLIESLITELKEVQLKVSNIKHEDTVLGIIKGLDANVDVVAKVLKEKGFSENDIREAFKELSTDTDTKEKKLRKEVGVGENEKLT